HRSGPATARAGPSPAGGRAPTAALPARGSVARVARRRIARSSFRLLGVGLSRGCGFEVVGFRPARSWLGDEDRRGGVTDESFSSRTQDRPGEPGEAVGPIRGG